MADLRYAAYVEQHAAHFLDELKAFAAIPSISTLSEHRADVRRAAEFVVAQLRDTIGLDNSRLIETAGHPLVYAEWLHAPDKPTVLIYGHYDVQPVDPIDLWATPPFEPTVMGDYILGRGVADDKGPTFAALKALQMLIALDGGLPVNVKVLIEGEEESGGKSIAAYVTADADHLRADCVLALDTLMQAPGVPTLCYALRGMLALDLIATGAPHDLHSGLYGGAIPNPLQALAWVLADLKGRDGHINLPGFYELMRPLSDQEHVSLERQAQSEEPGLRAAAGVDALVSEQGYRAGEAVVARPTFEVHGIAGGFTGEGSKTVIPATATAKISLRLVPDQQPDVVFQLVCEHVRELTPPGIAIDVRKVHQGDAVVLSLDAAPLRAADRALAAEFGRPVEYVRMGGSIPVVALFDSILQAPVVLMGFALPDDNFHAPNEHFYLPNYYAAMRSVAGFLGEMAQG